MIHNLNFIIEMITFLKSSIYYCYKIVGSSGQNVLYINYLNLFVNMGFYIKNKYFIPCCSYHWNSFVIKYCFQKNFLNLYFGLWIIFFASSHQKDCKSIVMIINWYHFLNLDFKVIAFKYDFFHPNLFILIMIIISNCFHICGLMNFNYIT